MGIQTYIDNYGPVPTTCPERQEYLGTLVHMLTGIEYFKSASGPLPPTWYGLDNLWAPCLPPRNALVTWHDTVVDSYTQWVRTNAGYWIRINETLLGYYLKVLVYLPLAFWRLDEGSGATAFDSSGNAYNGTYVGPTLANDTGPDGIQCPTFDGTNDYVNNVDAALLAAFSALTGSMMIWAKVGGAGTWTDAAERQLFYVAVDVSNRIRIYKSVTANKLTWNYTASGTAENVNKTGVSNLDWSCFVLTWDKGADQVIAYYDGAQNGAIQTGLGVWVGVPSKIRIGDRDGAKFWDGSLSLGALWNTVLTPAQIADLAIV